LSIRLTAILANNELFVDKSEEFTAGASSVLLHEIRLRAGSVLTLHAPLNDRTSIMDNERLLKERSLKENDLLTTKERRLFFKIATRFFCM
jgi:hypothetical protein